MQSKRKSNSVITYEPLIVDGVTVGVRFHVEGVQTSIDADMRKLPEATREQACIHGIVQKISDRAAIGRDPETGASATPQEKFEAMKECAERLINGGPWNAVSTGTGASGGVLYRAMRALYPQAWTTKADFAEYIKSKAASESERLGKHVSENDVRTGLMGVKKISKEIERLRQEEGKAVAVDATGMLQELEA